MDSIYNKIRNLVYTTNCKCHAPVHLVIGRNNYEKLCLELTPYINIVNNITNNFNGYIGYIDLITKLIKLDVIVVEADILEVVLPAREQFLSGCFDHDKYNKDTLTEIRG